MSNLYIAAKAAGGTLGQLYHLYIVYDPDGIPASGDELVLRSGPQNDYSLPLASMRVELGVPILLSRDGQENNPSNPIPDPEDRNFTLLSSGSNADSMWGDMLSFAASLAENTPTSNIENTPFQYSPLISNSNSMVASLLASVGINIFDNMPVLGGDLDGDGENTLGQTARLSINLTPAVQNFLSGSQGDTMAGGAANISNVFIDTAGSDGESGHDTFYGGVANNKINESIADGRDSYVYLTKGYTESLSIEMIKDFSGNVIGKRIHTPDGSYDDLYSIEQTFTRTFSGTHSIGFTNLNAGIEMRDVSDIEIASLNSDLNGFDEEGDFIVSAFTVNLGSNEISIFGNIGTINGSNNED